MRNPQTHSPTKTLSICLIALALHASGTSAAEVTGHSSDKTSGRMLGGWTAFLIGGAAAGPVGAIVAGLGGAWAGGEIQEASGTNNQLHHVKTDAGQTLTLRSPHQTFAVGEQVTIAGSRPKAVAGN